jgi:hypothetical protein
MILDHHGASETHFGVRPDLSVRSGEGVPAILLISAMLFLGVVSGATWKNRARTPRLGVTPSVEAAFFPESNSIPSLALGTTTPSGWVSASGGTEGAAPSLSGTERPASAHKEHP